MEQVEVKIPFQTLTHAARQLVCVLIWLLCWGETRHLTMSEVTCMGYCIYNVVCMCVSVLLWRPFASCNV